MGAAARTLFLQIQPAQFLRRQLDVEGGQARAGFAELSGADEGEGGERLVEDVGESDVDGEDVALLRQLVDAGEALEVVFAVPAADEFCVFFFIRGGAAGEEEAAGLAGPGEQRELSFGEPGAGFGIGCADAAGPDGVDHSCQGKIVADGGFYAREDTVSVLGNVTPKWIGGLNNSFSFKGLSLGFLIDFVQGNQITSFTRYRMEANGTAKFTEKYREHSEPLPGVTEVLDANGHVTGYTPNTKLVDGQTAWSMRAWGEIGEEFVLDGSFVMLREVVLGYTLQPSFLKKTPFKSMRVSAVGRNLWYIEEHMQDMGISPETNLNTQAGATGVEVFSMPTTRSYGLTLNLTF